MDIERLMKDEEGIVERIKEWLWNDGQVVQHVKDQIDFYWLDSYGLSDKKQLTDLEEEFICQVQVQTMMGILAKVMRS